MFSSVGGVKGAGPATVKVGAAGDCLPFPLTDALPSFPLPPLLPDFCRKTKCSN
jgi:hypothetical protein